MSFEVILAMIVVALVIGCLGAAKDWLFKQALVKREHYTSPSGAEERDSINKKYKVAAFSKGLLVVMVAGYVLVVLAMLISQPSVETIAIALFFILPLGLAYMFIFAGYIMFVHLILAKMRSSED